MPISLNLSENTCRQLRDKLLPPQMISSEVSFYLRLLHSNSLLLGLLVEGGLILHHGAAAHALLEALFHHFTTNVADKLFEPELIGCLAQQLGSTLGISFLPADPNFLGAATTFAIVLLDLSRKRDKQEKRGNLFLRLTLA